MLGFIVVTPNHAIVRPDSIGSFTLPEAAGGHVYAAFGNPRKLEMKQSFEVPKHGDGTSTLRFRR
jgi:hypothetical protein